MLYFSIVEKGSLAPNFAGPVTKYVYNVVKNGCHPKWLTNEKCALVNSACFKEFKESISGPVSGAKTVPSSYDC